MTFKIKQSNFSLKEIVGLFKIRKVKLKNDY